ncbi:hypothetical protein C8A00DRAFT_38419 [Chaetomidium leptoderma]|uniref:RING-type E3 ubiquitin transferase n=1 Tax=Chaetomidium leptoderma TaxID=669021 RepID=A0AAN6ZT12_9PEZI|nr:hypothetical protein C8A00DRAFT_38419 [Chaetomidium leptoderma]
MASSGGNHLGAAAGREVVFCHACQNEWYRDERPGSLACPSCESTFTEIIESASDPREDAPSPFGFGGGLNPYLRRPGGSDSDPDEGDIEDHLRSNPQAPFGQTNPGDRHFGAQPRANTNESDAIFRRFADMLVNDFGAGRAARDGPAAGGGGGLFPPQEHVPQPGTTVRHTTFGTGLMRATVTVTSGTIGTGPEVAPVNMSTLFEQLFGNPWGPGAADPNRRARGAPDQPDFPLPGGLHNLLHAIYNPASARHGDAVFSQEALDRIVTQLMEASPQTNAAPPASQMAIDTLEKKKVDDEMLGPEGKAGCTICIDDINKGDEVSVLPCKHWYHGECVILWLKEHNTCPICRKPIEVQGGGGNGNNREQQPYELQQQQQPQDSQPASAFIPQSASSTPSLFAASAYPPDPFSFSTFTTERPRPERERPLRTVRENIERLNAIRNLASAGPESQRQPRSASQRRNSHSPTGAWCTSDAENASRTRVRSPSTSRDRDWGREMGAAWDWGGEFSASSSGGGGGGGGGERRPGGVGRRESTGQQSQQQQQQQSSHQSQQQQQGNSGSGGSGGGGGGGGGPFGWFRDHFARRS